MNSTARVGLARNGSRRQKVFQALDLIRTDLAPIIAGQVLVKPNFLSGANQLASSHVDAVWGVVDFLLTLSQPPIELVVAEGGNEKFSGEAWRNFGFDDLVAASPIPVRLLDLNQETEWEETSIILADRSETTVRMPKTVLQCPTTLSLAVAKTHDVCVVTLALKNMIMGTLYKPDRIKMHGYGSHAERTLPTEAQILNVNLTRVARFLKPDIAVIDGTRGLQGNGPGGDDGIDFGIVAASRDVCAADAVVAKAMGFEPLELGLLHYADELGLGVADLSRIEIFHDLGPASSVLAEVTTAFKPHDSTQQQLQWQEPELAHYLPA